MSNLSRGFIVANSLSKMMMKNQQKRQARAFRRLSVASNGQSGGKQREQENIIQSLTQQLKNKENDIHKMEQMFKEYASWRSKLE